MIIKLLGSRKERAKGFYALITNGSTSSVEKDEFCGIDEKQLEALKKTKCPYKELYPGEDLK